MKLKKGDEVIITTGKDKGKRGKVERVVMKKMSVLLPGLNVFKRHVKKRDEKNPGGIIDFSRPIGFANVMLICPKCGKPARVGYTIDGKEKKRQCKECKKSFI